jgi:hypothetical protein
LTEHGYELLARFLRRAGLEPNPVPESENVVGVFSKGSDNR